MASKSVKSFFLGFVTGGLVVFTIIFIKIYLSFWGIGAKSTEISPIKTVEIYLQPKMEANFLKALHTVADKQEYAIRDRNKSQMAIIDGSADLWREDIHIQASNSNANEYDLLFWRIHDRPYWTEGETIKDFIDAIKDEVKSIPGGARVEVKD